MKGQPEPQTETRLNLSPKEGSLAPLPELGVSQTHPISQIVQPEILTQDPNNFIDIVMRILYAAIPTMICFELNIVTTFINIYFIGNNDKTDLLVAVGLGSVIANMLGFLLLESVNIGFAAACTSMRKVPNANEAIGLMYQKTLAVNFIMCVLITPILYLSDRILLSLGFNEVIARESTRYVWGLLPSFYLYCFYDTTRNYLQSEGKFYAPLIIQAASAMLHLLLAWLLIEKHGFEISGAIWAKNISDVVNSLALYIYIVYWEPTKDTWIEWSIKAANGWGDFIKVVLSIVISSYLEALAFQIMYVVACQLPTFELIAAHLAISNSVTAIFVAGLGISHCITNSIAVSKAEGKTRLMRKKVWIGLLLILVFSAAVVVELLIHRDDWLRFFTKNEQVINHLSELFPVVVAIVVLEPLQICMSGIVRVIRGTLVLKIYILCFYLIGIGLGALLAFRFQLDLKGIWMGWVAALAISIIFFGRILYSANWEDPQVTEEDQMAQILRHSVAGDLREKEIEMSSLNIQLQARVASKEEHDPE